MKKHLFITGPSGVGKTTLLRQELSGSLAMAGGFITERGFDDNGTFLGVYLRPAAAAAGIEGLGSYRFLDYSVTPPGKDNEVFRINAVQMLEESEFYPLTVIDEFGGFEMVIPQFRQALQNVLNGDRPVIGVLKGIPNAKELQSRFGLGQKYMDLVENLHAALRGDSDTVVLEMKSRGDETVRRIVHRWASEYGISPIVRK